MEQTSNKNSLRDSFVQAVNEQVGKGIYVWGGNGEILDDMEDPVSWVERHETSRENVLRALRLFADRIEKRVFPVRAFDCSGLVYWALKNLGVLKEDVSSRGLYALCEPIEACELMPGDLVFHNDGKQIVHVGVWTGDGQIECRGRDYGVVRNKRSKGYWNRFGRLPAFASEPTAACVGILGGSVRVREGGGVHTRCVGIVHKGERYPLLGRAGNGWYKVLWRGTEAYVTNNTRYTEVQNG